MTTTPTPCTVRAHITEICGKPAVCAFTGRTGERFAECAEHAPPGAAGEIAVVGKPAAPVAVGETVCVCHIGVEKFGRVVKVGRVGVLVEVPIHGGKATKVIRRRFEEII